MSDPKPPLRKVVKTVFTQNKYNRRGEGCLWFTLDCGHEVVTKQSDGRPARKYCRECQYNAQQLEHL